jgi:hypothetical protein
MKPGFLLEAARKHAKGLVRGGIGLCVFCLLVLLLNGKFVYNFVAGPFAVTPMMSELPATREFAQVAGNLVQTTVVEQRTTTVRMFRILSTSTHDISAKFSVAPMNGKFLVIKTGPEFSGNTARGRLVSLPQDLRTSDLITKTEVDGRKLKSDDLCSMMLDATTDYRTDANLFVILAAFFLATGLIGTVVFAIRATSPQKYPMLRLMAQSGPVLSTLRRVEQEFIAEGDKAFAGPLMISPAWVYDQERPLLFPLKDVIGVAMKVSGAGASRACSVEFWLRSEPQSFSVKAGANECITAIKALAARIPWAIVEPGSSFLFQWKKDRQFCIAEMERRRKQMQAAPAPASVGG